MDYTNLMVGDWVRFRNDYPQKELQGKIAKVRGINGRVDVRTLDGEYRNSEHPNWLEPIPITPEILADNGFEYYSEDAWVLSWAHDFILVCEVGGVRYNSRIKVCHVHQLQHLLLLCGIEINFEL